MAEKNIPDNALSDSDMMEALAPLDKQLRSLNQIKLALEGYFAASSRIQGLTANIKELTDRAASLEADFEARKKAIDEQMAQVQASVEQKRNDWTTAAKVEVNAIAAEKEVISGEVTKLKTDLNALTARYEATNKDLTDKLASKELEVNDQIAALVAKREAEQALFDDVRAKFEAFLGEHGLARPVVAEVAAPPTP